MKYFRYFLILIFIFFASKNARATHNRAGEITYKWIGPSPALTYLITITTYTKRSSTQADRPTLDSVYFGDDFTPHVFQRDSINDNLPNDIRINYYNQIHTYSGNGNFLIHFTDPNRNANVSNIPHSVSQPFYIESLLVISGFIGTPNSSPVMTCKPVDQGCINRIFIHNPCAHDPDPNDSLSYELTECKGIDGLPIQGYAPPSASHSFSLNPITGDLKWDSPMAEGEYNVAFNIIQWRDGVQIGYVERDMQILISNCDDYPPVIDVITDTCVLAGDTISFDVTAIDPDHDFVTLTGSGGALDGNIVQDPAHLTPLITNNDTVVSKFSWITKCHHVRRQPYLVEFKAEDHPSTGPSLVDLKGTFIRIIAPGPASATAVPNGNAIDLSWTAASCGGIAHYNIYRRNGQYPFAINCPCDNGVPSFTGYTLIGTDTDTTFSDDNNGQGLTIGIEYCYIITAVYPDGSESCASPQACALLKKDAPVITNADVTYTDLVNGSVYVAWSKPTELDTLQFRPPYEYRIYHSPGFFGGSFTYLQSFPNINTDTTYVDTIINTQTEKWSYKIEMYYTDSSTFPPTLKLKGQTSIASTVFLTITPTDNMLNLSWEEHVPWNNVRYDIFKQNPSLTYDSITTVFGTTFSDTGLVNGNQYCYFVRSRGSYSFSGFIDPILNSSQKVCAIPVDNVPPCSPDLSVNSDCDNNANQLVWTNPNNNCADDVLKYYIYFGASEDGGFELIDSLLSPNDTVYLHAGLSRISGCYKVTGIDSVGNETVIPEIVCVDTCRQYVLPSVFTPDGNGKNDFFHPCDGTTSTALQEKNCPPYKNVKSVEMKIFNRWGNLVFETNDKDINWDGKFKNTNKDCQEGVYFYTCKVIFFSIKNEQTAELKGTIELIR